MADGMGLKSAPSMPYAIDPTPSALDHEPFNAATKTRTHEDNRRHENSQSVSPSCFHAFAIPVGFSFLWIQQILELVRELVDVAEVTIHRRKPDVRHFVEPLELFHHESADVRRCNFLLGTLLQRRLHSIGHRLERRDADRPLFTRFEQPCDQLLPVEPFARAVLLHHHVRNLVDPLVAGEPLPAVEAFAPAPDDLPFLRFARVDDLVAQVRAVWTLHTTLNCKRSTLRTGSPLLSVQPSSESSRVERRASCGVSLLGLVGQPPDATEIHSLL